MTTYYCQTKLCFLNLLTGVVAIATGSSQTMVVKQDGSVWSTGIETDSKNAGFVQVIPSGAAAAGVGTSYSIVLMKNGDIMMNTNPTSVEFYEYQQKISGIKTVSAGSGHSIILTDEGRVYISGWNKFGQLGDGTTKNEIKFRRNMHGTTAAVAAGDAHSVVVNEDGSVWASGRNNLGQIGDNSLEDKLIFTKVMAGGAVTVAAGGYHTMLVKHDGSVWATGWNEYGQLGDGSTITRLQYAQVIAAGAKAVAAGRQHSMILKRDGSVWAAGDNFYGQLGLGSKRKKTKFMRVISVGVKAIAAGAGHSMVLKHDGSIWATGSNEFGQFGDGSTVSETNFVRIPAFDDGLQPKRSHTAVVLPFLRTSLHSHLKFELCCTYRLHLASALHPYLPFILRIALVSSI